MIFDIVIDRLLVHCGVVVLFHSSAGYITQPDISVAVSIVSFHDKWEKKFTSKWNQSRMFPSPVDDDMNGSRTVVMCVVAIKEVRLRSAAKQFQRLSSSNRCREEVNSRRQEVSQPITTFNITWYLCRPAPRNPMSPSA